MLKSLKPSVYQYKTFLKIEQEAAKETLMHKSMHDFNNKSLLCFRKAVYFGFVKILIEIRSTYLLTPGVNPAKITQLKILHLNIY